MTDLQKRDAGVALRREARAWRVVATYVAPGWRYVGEPWEMGGLGMLPAIRELAARCEQGAMVFRLSDHYAESETPDRKACGCYVQRCATSEEWALFCLFLALECEDEAASLTPKSRRRSSNG